MKLQAAMALVLALSLTASFDALSVNVPVSQPIPVALCDLRTSGVALLDKTIAIAGSVQQDIEAAFLRDSRCQLAVRLEMAQGVPSLIECFIGHNEALCGGIKHNGQHAIVIGKLVAAPKAVPVKGHGTWWTPAYLEVQEYRSIDENVASQPDTLTQTITKLDGEVFDAFNRCADPAQLEKHAGFFAESVEFYHDNGGVTWNRADMLANTKKYACGNYTREVILSSIMVYPIKDFGAVEVGSHRFCQTASGKCEGLADFTMVWQQTNDGWKITRVLSYGHRANPER